MYINRKYKLLKFLFTIMSEKTGDMEGLFQILGTMKGIPQKYGQFLYLKDRRQYSSFGKLLDEGVVYTNKDLLRIINKKLAQVNIKLKEAPIASASIGQVYEGYLDDESIIVKIQYPSIIKYLNHDIKFIRRVIGFFFKLFRFPKESQKILMEYIDEFETSFNEETDYIKEKENLIRFQKAFLEDKSIHVPQVYEEYTDTTIIVEEKVSGIPLGEFLKNAENDKKREILDIMFTFYFESFLKHNMLHGDSHTGNFFVDELDDNLILQVVDFGCVKQYNEDFVDGIKNLIIGLRENNEELIHSSLLIIGFENEALYSYDKALVPILRVVFEPFLEDEPFDFKYWRINYQLNTIMGSKIFSETLVLPKDLLIIFRVFQGLLAHIYYLEEDKDFNVYKYIK